MAVPGGGFYTPMVYHQPILCQIWNALFKCVDKTQVSVERRRAAGRLAQGDGVRRDEVDKLAESTSR